MTTLAAHPFIRSNRIHRIKFQPKEREAFKITTQSEEVRSTTNNIEERPKSKSKLLAGAVAGIGALAIVTTTAMAYGSGLSGSYEPEVQIDLTKASVVSEGVRLVNNQIPADYPGIYPGEQKVIYHLAPLPDDKVVEEMDAKGCRWLRIAGKTKGILAYPKIGADDRQVCANPANSVVPLQARMARDMLPEVAGSSLRIIDVIDSKTGTSMIARNVPSLESMIGMGGPDVEIASLSQIPSQQASSRQVTISTASNMPQAIPTQNMPQQTRGAPGRGQPTVIQTRADQRRDPDNFEPVRRAAPYVPPADDVMVPMSDINNLKPIRPGDALGATAPRRNESPSGSPLEGYESISGN